MTGDEIGRARLAETLLRRDKRRETDDLEMESLLASALESVPMARPRNVPAVVDMAADMNIEALLEKQAGELGMLVAALGQTVSHVAEIFGLGRFTVRTRRF